MDVDTIVLGVDFTKVIAQALSTSKVLLAIIGPQWLTATDEDGQRRLDDPDDTVRMEIGAALERDISVIPILVEGAVMPRRQQLPEDLARLAHRNALSVRHESFRVDTERLLEAIEQIVRVTSSSHPQLLDREYCIFVLGHVQFCGIGSCGVLSGSPSGTPRPPARSPTTASTSWCCRWRLRMNTAVQRLGGGFSRVRL
jgi:hypothetical protein